MKYLYLILAVISWVLILIAFFQNVGLSYQVRFLNSYPYITVFMLWLITLSISFGIFITLFIKSLLSGDKDFDDEFDL